MPIKWKSGRQLRPQILLEKLGEIAEIMEDGSLNFEPFTKDELDSAFFSMLKFPSDVSESTKRRLIRGAELEVLRENNLTRSAFESAINEQYRKANSQPEVEYRLISSISLLPPLPAKRVRINGCTIRFSTAPLPKKYSARAEILRNYRVQHSPETSRYTTVIVSIKSKSTFDAVEEAIDALDLYRAYLCLFYNNPISLTFGGNTNPINTIVLGEAHTLHARNGQSSHDGYWSENFFRPMKPVSIPDRRFAVIQSDVKWALNNTSPCRYRDHLENALLRYVRALDDANLNSAALKLWGAIEALIVGNEKNFDSVSKRIAFLFTEPEYHRQIVEHLREYRNQTIHQGLGQEAPRTHCYQLQRYFKQLVLFLLHNAETFNSLDEARAFLDLPPSIKLLKDEKERINRALKFRTS